MKTLLPILLLTLITGCNTGFDKTLIVNAKPPNLELINETNSALFYIVVEQGLSDDLETDPCKDFQPNIEAKSTVIIPYNEIEGVNETTELVWVYWTNCDGLTDFNTYRLYQN